MLVPMTSVNHIPCALIVCLWLSCVSSSSSPLSWTLHRPYFWNSQSLLSSGHTCRVFSHLEMQWKWKAWLQIPQATVHSSVVAAPWLAWHSIHRSMMWFRQMAQLSTTISQAHRATAFHYILSVLMQFHLDRDITTFFTSNLFLLSTAASVVPFFTALVGTFALLDVASTVASSISTSAMVTQFLLCNWSWDVNSCFGGRGFGW